MYKLKQSQRAKVRQFMAITGTDDHTASNCLTQNDWRLDMSTDNFYQDPMKYYIEAPRAPVDKRKIDSLFTKYRTTREKCWNSTARLSWTTPSSSFALVCRTFSECTLPG